jgi:hypothetical protein
MGTALEINKKVKNTEKKKDKKKERGKVLKKSCSKKSLENNNCRT